MTLLTTFAKTTLPFLALVFVVYTIVSTYLSYRKLRHIKGPFIASISPLWLFYQTIRARVNVAGEEVLREYGSPARIGPNMILTDDPVILRTMLAPRSPFTKGHWFKGMKFDPRADNLLSMADEKNHADLRTKLMPGYSGKDVPTLESDIDKQVMELIFLIGTQVENNKAFDFAMFAGYFTLDSLTEIAFGQALGFLTANKDLYKYIQTSTDFFPIMELGTNHPIILNILNSRIMQASAAPKPTDRIGFGAIIGVAQEAVAARFGPDAKHIDDMLGSFVKHGLTQVECESESMLQILAGADSTATTLRTTLLYILTSPATYSHLVTEITTAVHSGNATYPVITKIEAASLAYLQACIKEGLRMFQPLCGLGSRVPPPAGATVNDVFIPGGTEVGIAMYAMMRREDVFGPDADTFRPERWLEDENETTISRERVWDLTFSTGRSSCLGKNIALMELGKALFELLRNYDFTIINPFNAMSTKCNAICIQKNMMLRAYPRKVKEF